MRCTLGYCIDVHHAKQEYFSRGFATVCEAPKGAELRGKACESVRFTAGVNASRCRGAAKEAERTDVSNADYELRTTDYGLRTTEFGIRNSDYGIRRG